VFAPLWWTRRLMPSSLGKPEYSPSDDEGDGQVVEMSLCALETFFLDEASAFAKSPGRCLGPFLGAKLQPQGDAVGSRIVPRWGSGREHVSACEGSGFFV
jgi:hypothetical protein